MQTMARTAAAGPALATVLLCAAPLLAQPRLTMDWDAMAEQLVTQLAPAPGEKILLVARPGQFDELIPPLRYALMRAGAIDLGVIDVIEEPYPTGWDGELLARNNAAARALYREMLRDFDGAIMLPGARPDHAVYAALQDLLHEGIGPHHPLPLDPERQRVPRSPGTAAAGVRAVIDATYQRALLETDYAGLAAAQQTLSSPRCAWTEVRGHLAARHRHPLPHRRTGRCTSATANAAKETDRPGGDPDRPRNRAAVGRHPGRARRGERQRRHRPFRRRSGTAAPSPGLAVRIENGPRRRRDGPSPAREAAEGGAGRRAGGRRARSASFALGFNPLLAVPERKPLDRVLTATARGIVGASRWETTPSWGGTVPPAATSRWNFFTDTTVDGGRRGSGCATGSSCADPARPVIPSRATGDWSRACRKHPPFPRRQALRIPGRRDGSRRRSPRARGCSIRFVPPQEDGGPWRPQLLHRGRVRHRRDAGRADHPRDRHAGRAGGQCAPVHRLDRRPRRRGPR